MHSGHALILKSSRMHYGDDGVSIAVMSGNFMQRCSPAVFGKYVRAEAAVRCGADIVLELPYPWSASGAEDFCRGGVAIAAGALSDGLTFGSESGDRGMLEKIAALKSSADFAAAVFDADRAMRSAGCAAVFEETLRCYGIGGSVGANDKLGAEYIRFAREVGINEFNIVTRDAAAKSASDIRNMVFGGGFDAVKPYIPSPAYGVYEKYADCICREDVFNEILFCHARLYIPQDTENALLRYAAKVAEASCSAAEFIKCLPTKKYTLSRLKREVLRSILPANVTEKPEITFLLAANERGCEHLAQIRKTARIKIITKPSDSAGLDGEQMKQYEAVAAADRLYALCSGRQADFFMKQAPVII